MQFERSHRPNPTTLMVVQMGVSRNAKIQFGVEVLVEKRQRLAALLACISNAWAQLEYHIASGLQYLISAPFKKDAQRRLDPVASEIFEAVELVGQRLNILRRVFAAKISDKALKADLEIALTEVRNASTHRGKMVHSYWGVSDDYPDHIIRAPSLHRGDRDMMHPCAGYRSFAPRRFVLAFGELGLGQAPEGQPLTAASSPRSA